MYCPGKCGQGQGDWCNQFEKLFHVLSCHLGRHVSLIAPEKHYAVALYQDLCEFAHLRGQNSLLKRRHQRIQFGLLQLRQAIIELVMCAGRICMDMADDLEIIAVIKCACADGYKIVVKPPPEQAVATDLAETPLSCFRRLVPGKTVFVREIQF